MSEFKVKNTSLSIPSKHISYESNGEHLASGDISSLSSIMPRVAISHSSYVTTHSRGRGIGSLNHQYRLNFSSEDEQGIDYLLCTVNVDNKPQRYIMKKFGWKELDRFFNNCTCNEVIIYGKNLRE